MMVLPVFQLAFNYLRKLSPPPLPSPCPQRELIYTENKLICRLFNMCNPFFYFRALPSVNVSILVWCTATIYTIEAIRLEG
jgi:hypothetical protein